MSADSQSTLLDFGKKIECPQEGCEQRIYPNQRPKHIMTECDGVDRGVLFDD